MDDFDSFDWSAATSDEQLAMARKASKDQLRTLARNYDWKAAPEKVLGWVMAQVCIDLDSALTAFFNGEPERFNYMPNRDVPEAYRGVARELDNICQRLNSGFYLVEPQHGFSNRKRTVRWLDFQQADLDDGRCGRWILDKRVLEPLLNDTLRLDAPKEPDMPSNLLLDILSPAIDLATKRVIEEEPKPVATSQSRRG